MNEAVNRKQTTRRRFRLRLAFACTAFSLLLSGTIVYRLLTHPERVRSLAESVIGKYVGPNVQIEAATFSWFEGIRLSGVIIGDPSKVEADLKSSVGNRPFFQCPRLEVEYDHWSLLRGDLVILNVLAIRPQCTISRQIESGVTNVSQVLQPLSSEQMGQVPKLPVIELRQARFLVEQRTGEDERIVEDLLLTVRGRPATANPLLYDVVWQELGDDVTGHSLVDLQAGRVFSVTGGLPWMSIEGVMTIVDVQFDGAGSWSRLLGLGGRVRVVAYDVSSSANTLAQRYATIELNNATISIPMNDRESSLPSDDRYLMFEDVNGRVTVRKDKLDARFDGMLRGARCEVSAAFSSTVTNVASLDDVDFEASIGVREFQLPRYGPHAPFAEDRFVRAWPQLQHIYDRFEPEAIVDLNMDVSKRAGIDEPLELDYAQVWVADGYVCPIYFPLPVGSMSGLIEITPNAVHFQNVGAYHNGGTVITNGYLDNPPAKSTGVMFFDAFDVPFDDALYDAARPRTQRLWDILDPEGNCDVHISFDLVPLADDEWSDWPTHAEIVLKGIDARYEGFPYRVSDISGEVFMTPLRTEVDVWGAHDNASVTVRGFTISDEGETVDGQLEILGHSMEINDALLGALPPEIEESVAVFRPAGVIDTTLQMRWSPEVGDLLPYGVVHLKEISVKPDALPLVFSDVTGDVGFDQDKLQYEDLFARFADATIHATGIHHFDLQEGPRRVHLKCTGMPVNEQTISCLPKAIGDALGDWRIEGAVDVSADIVANTKEEEVTGVDASVICRALTLSHPRLATPVTNVEGTVNYDGLNLSGEGMTATLIAPFEVDFLLEDVASLKRGALSLRSGSIPLDKQTRACLPSFAQGLWDDVEASGEVALALDSLAFESSSQTPDSGMTWSVQGHVDLAQVSLPGLLPLSNANGRLTLSGLVIDPAGGTALTGTIDLSSASLFDRQISTADSPWSFALNREGRGQILIDQIHATSYGGTIDAALRVDLDEQQAEFVLDATARAIDLEPFLQADLPVSVPDNQRPKASGQAHGRLTLAGVLGDPKTYLGTGGVEIREGALYRLPIILAILNFLNPATPPDPNAFDYAWVNLSINGREMRLDDILLDGPALRFVGSGSLSLVDWHVSLFLRSDGRWRNIPILSEVIQGVSTGLMELEVVGPFRQPAVRTRTLRKMDSEVRDIFRPKRSDNRVQPRSGGS